MRGCLGWLLLLPLVFAFWLVVTVSNACIKRGGLWRLLAVLFSLIVGGICIQVGYWFNEEGITILGWTTMIGGGLMAIIGILTALFRTKEGIEQQEEMEKIEEKRKEEAWRAVKEMAREILAQDKIDDLETYKQIVRILEQEPSDGEASDLVSQLKKLKEKQEKTY